MKTSLTKNQNPSISSLLDTTDFLEIINSNTLGTIVMGDTCHMHNCNEVSYDDCSVCGQPTCKKHGRMTGDYFVCKECSSGS